MVFPNIPRSRKRMKRLLQIFLTLRLYLLAFLALVAGCTPKESIETYRVKGTVVFKDKAVPKGNVFFEPEGDEHSFRPQGFAAIVNGEFDTSAPGHVGVVGGDYILRIQGFDGIVASEAPFGQALFPEYTMKAIFNKNDNSIEIKVLE